MLSVDVVAKLDERAAANAATQLKNQMTRAGTVSGEAYTKALNEAAAKYKFSTDRIGAELEKQFASHGQRAAQHFGTGFGGQLTKSLPGVSGFASTMAGYEGAAAKTGALAGRALGMAFTGAVGGLVGAAGYTLFKGFERYEAIDAARARLNNLNRTFQATGKAAIDVKATIDTVNKVVLGTPFALDKAFSVATRALASNTGDLQRFMTDVANAAGFAGEGIDDIGEAFLKIANTGKVSMEEVQNQLRNIPVLPWLQETLHVTGSQLAKMIHDNKIGLEDLLKAVEQHAPGFAKAAGDTVQGAISNMKTSIARTGANFLGAIFGNPTEQNNTLVESLKHITEKLEDVGKWVNNHKTEIRDFFRKAADTAGELVTELGKIIKFLNDHKELIYVVATAYGAWKSIEGVAALITSLKTISTFLGVTLPAEAAASAASISAAFAAIVIPVALTAADAPGATKDTASDKQIAGNKYAQQHGGQMPKGYQQWLQGSGPMPPELAPLFKPGAKPTDKPDLGPGPAPWTAPGGKKYRWDWAKGGWVDEQGNPPGAGGPGPHGGAISPPPGDADGTGKKPHLPKAPVVPYNTSLPAGFDNLPMSASLFSAESSYLDARQKLAEKQARLTQLEHDGAATEQDVLDARNDVITTQRDFQQNEMKLYEERDTVLGKHNKQLKTLLAELGDIGAGLDQDFGISKGLAGIAENITKFIANLAAAPLLGALGAQQISAGYKPGEAGQGIMGMLGMSGAFGPQYQIAGTAFGTPGRGGAGGYGGYGQAGFGRGAYPGDAALLANVPAGHYNSSGDLSKGLGDCSSAVEDLVNIMDGRPTAGRSMSTGNGAEWLTQHGFLPGMGGLGDFRVGFNGGHMQATLPGGTPFNWGSDAAAGQRGIGGSGADDPSFTSHFYRPSGAGGGPSGAGPALAPSAGGGTGAAPRPAAPGPAGGGGKPVGPGAATQWKTNVDGSKTGLDAAGNATGDYIPAGGGGGPQVAPSGFGSGGGVGAGLGGGGGASDMPGPQPGVGPGPGLPGLPGTSNPTRIGGVAPPQGKGSGFAGIGGLPMAAASAGIGALTGGAGSAAAQSMMQLVNRTIALGGQMAGIGVQGLAETFLPAGSDLAANSWLTKIAGGIAGAQPMLPNMAGKGEGDDGSPTPEQVVGQGQGLNGRPSGLGPDGENTKNVDNTKNVTNNVTVNGANVANEQSMANTVADHQNAMYAA